jgi:hypothetical protein
MCYLNVSIGVSIETHHARIGTFVVKCSKEYAVGVCEDVVMRSQMWFLGLVITVLLVIRGVELNPGC